MSRGGATFLERVLRLLEDEAVLRPPSSQPVVRFTHPQQLQNILSLHIGKPASSEEELLDLIRETLHYSVKTSHPHFHNQLYGGVDQYGLAGSWITEALNTSQYTYEVAPVFTLVEREVLRHVLQLIGFEDGDGIFSPGGSISNMYALVLARYRAFPQVKKKGISGLPPLAIFCSQEAHYSFLKSAHWLGLGTDNVHKIESDSKGHMIPQKLEDEIQSVIAAGKKPFLVVATGGATVLGCFDPLHDIAGICSKYNLWMHVDACWGGSMLLSKKHKHLLEGIYRADSVSWNPHKMIGTPLQCSLLLIKEKGLLHHCNAAAATYLFQQDKFYDVSFDTGDKSVQCGRKVDAFKLWLMWRAHGDIGLEKLVDNAMDCARYFEKKIANNLAFRLVIPQCESNNVCFWYIPPSLRGKEETEEWWAKMHQVAPMLKERLVMAGTVLIGYQPLIYKGLKNFFRLVVTCQPPATYEGMDHIIEQIEKYGSSM